MKTIQVQQTKWFTGKAYLICCSISASSEVTFQPTTPRITSSTNPSQQKAERSLVLGSTKL